MESRIVKQAREFCSSLFSEMELSESQEFEIFSTAMLATTLANKVDNEILKDTWLNDNISGIDGFFIIIDNALYSINNYSTILENNEDFKEVKFCFIEAKNSSHVDYKSILSFYNTLEKIFKSQCEEELLTTIMQCINDLYEKSKKQKNIPCLKINFYFCTQKTETKISDLRESWEKEIKKSEEDIKEFMEIETNLIGSEFLRKIYEVNKTEQTSISIPKNNLTCISDKCFIGYVNALSILKAISIEHDNIKVLNNNVFEDNIRLFLGDTSINKNIQETVQHRSENFHLYNNCLTLVNAKSENGMKDYIFHSIRIINGCQTINSLFEVYKNSKSNETLENIILPIKIIEAIDEDEIEFIATSANRQNQIDTYQLLSNREFFKELEKYFCKNTINNKTIFYKRRMGQESKQDCINVDLLIIMRSLMSTVFQIPHRASGYFDSTMNKYLQSFENLNKESYCKLIYIVTYLFIFVEDYLNNMTKKDKTHLLKHHITFIVFKIANINVNIKKPKKQGEIPEWDNETINDTYNEIYALLSDISIFKKLMSYILEKINNTDLKSSKIAQTKQKILSSPINKAIPDFETFCSHLQEGIITAKS
ncbi:AIPR family protein [Helicobacter japonicus]|uniref:AIPR family protein n=1 Tax=Helicobacter japonicus TaxID=425400 RepID=UPI0030135B73